MKEQTRIVKLPGFEVHVRPTGKTLKVSQVPDFGLFEHDGEVWEKMGDSNACLSNFDDQSEVLPWVSVRELATLNPQPRKL